MRHGQYRPVFRGLLAGAGILVFFAAYVALDVASGYDGHCAGYIPFTGRPYDCTFTEYMRLNLSFTFRAIAYYYWYAILLILVLPAALFPAADRLMRGNTQ